LKEPRFGGAFLWNCSGNSTNPISSIHHGSFAPLVDFDTLVTGDRLVAEERTRCAGGRLRLR